MICSAILHLCRFTIRTKPFDYLEVWFDSLNQKLRCRETNPTACNVLAFPSRSGSAAVAPLWSLRYGSHRKHSQQYLDTICCPLVSGNVVVPWGFLMLGTIGVSRYAATLRTAAFC